MFYVVWRTQIGGVGGFITQDDDDDAPKAWPTRKAAEDAMHGHILELYSEVIEL